MLVLADNNPVRHIRRPYANWALIGLCCVVFLLDPSLRTHAFTPALLQDAVYGTGILTKAGYTPPPADWGTVLWTSVSYIFLHGSLLHLAGNMVALWVFGNNIEDSMGPGRYVLFFVLCGMGGAAAEGLFSPDPGIPIVGASGAVAGVMGAYLLLHPRARILVLAGMWMPVLVPASAIVGLTVALDLLSALLPADPAAPSRIAFLAHLGGFVTGALLILVLRYRDVPLFQPAAIYPPDGFGRWGRLMLDLGPRPGAESGRQTWVRGLLFGLKSMLFLLGIVLAAEWLVA